MLANRWRIIRCSKSRRPIMKECGESRQSYGALVSTPPLSAVVCLRVLPLCVVPPRLLAVLSLLFLSLPRRRLTTVAAEHRTIAPPARIGHRLMACRTQRSVESSTAATLPLEVQRQELGGRCGCVFASPGRSMCELWR